MKYKPHDYQKFAVDFIETHPEAAVLLECGLGKTHGNSIYFFTEMV